MNDLDWSNVHADASFAYDEFLNRMMNTFDSKDTVELERLRYFHRIEVHAHYHVADIDLLRVLDYLLLGRLATSLCEGCFGRTGCDMCNPPDFADEFDYQTDHYERFGRPAFPNEY